MKYALNLSVAAAVVAGLVVVSSAADGDVVFAEDFGGSQHPRRARRLLAGLGAVLVRLPRPGVDEMPLSNDLDLKPMAVSMIRLSSD